MRQLTIQGVFWCWRHDHPVVTLAADDGGSPLSLEGPFGIPTVPAHVVDAVVIAWRTALRNGVAWAWTWSR